MDTEHPLVWKRIGISKSWYYAIKSGRSYPSVASAIKMFRETGQKHGLVEHLEFDAIEQLEKTMNLQPQRLANNHIISGSLSEK